jgi:hypothetical protein
MATNKLPGIRLNDREVRILIFLWKWKLVSNTALTSKRFFPATSDPRAYNRLLDLKRAALIEVRCDDKIQTFAWTLTQKGFKAIREFLPALREEGFRSEYFEHDFLVTAFHLGDWLIELPPNVRFFTEQELRRCAFDEYPSWVPRTEHRPDGYFGFTGDDKIIPVAIEVELNRKTPSAYEGIGEFYADTSSVYRVLWCVPSIAAAKRIHTKIREFISVRNNIHNLILVSDFRDSGWQSPIIEGPEAGKTVRQFLGEIPRRKGVESTWNSTTRLLLQSRKSYVKSKVSPLTTPAPKALLPTASNA